MPQDAVSTFADSLTTDELSALMLYELSASNSVPEVTDAGTWAYADRETLDQMGW